MSAASNDWRGRWVARAVCAALLAGGLACATPTRSAPAEAEGAVLSDVRVEQQGETTVVTLRGVGQPLYAAMEEDGRVVLDLDGVRPVGVPQEIALVGGLVHEVEVSPMVDGSGAPFTRVALAIDEPVEYDVIPEGADLTVHVLPAGEPLAADDVPAAMDTAATSGPEEVFTAPRPMAGGDAGLADDGEGAAMAEAEAPPAAAPADAPAATTLQGVEMDGSRVRLRADGAIRGAEHFVLEDPARLVIDVKGLQSALPASRVDLGGAAVTQARVGQHPGKVRVVLDGTEAARFGEAAFTPAADGLVVSLDGAPMASATPQAMEASAPASPEAAGAEAGGMEAPGAALPSELAAASTHVTGVDLLEGAGSARVVIVTEGNGSYNMFEPDPQTVVVSLPDAALLPGADARIAPKPGGPVSLVMAFQQPEVERPEVRVVITRGPGDRPMVTREGENVVVTFDLHGSKASTPPAIVGEGMDGEVVPASVAPPAGIDNGDAFQILQEGGLLDGKQYVGRRISLDFKDVDIDDVLRLVAEVSDLNIIAGDDVTGKVTIRLVDVPWDQALDVILLTKGLGFVKIGNVLRIAPQQLLQQESEARLQERRAKEKLEDLVVKFQPVNYAAVGEVSKMVQRLLSPRGTVNTDARTNTVIIKDIPSVIDESVALIKAIDTPTPQVLIEAKIVEANLDFSRELGTVWGFGVQPLTDAFDSGSPVRTDVGNSTFNPHPDPRLLGGDEGAGDLNNFVVTNPISSAPTALVNLGAFLLDDQFNLEVQLQAAESTGEGKVISSPRVVTLDNRQAEIQQGVAIPYQTFENGDAQLQFVDAVLSLKVKPHITADKSIIMQLEVTRDAPDDSVATGSVGAPAIAKNQAKTETLVRDGQTLVIGGIYTVQKGTRMSRVPYLWQIPVLGYAFRNHSIRDIRKELLIFVTPRVVQMPQLGS